MRSLRRII